MRNLLICVVLAVAVLCSSCATIFSESSYPVRIESNPPGAQYVIRDLSAPPEMNQVHVGITPETVELDASNAAKYYLTFNAPGYQEANRRIDASYDKVLFANIALLIFVEVGVVVDCMTGAAWKLPGNVSVTLMPLPATGDAPAVQPVTE